MFPNLCLSTKTLPLIDLFVFNYAYVSDHISDVNIRGLSYRAS